MRFRICRIWSPATPDFSEKITLDPLNQPPIGNHGMLIIKMPPSATNPTRTNGSSYTVEFRRKTGWDRNIPKDAVLIHEVRGNSFSYLQPQIWGQFVSGEEFFTPDPKVFTKIIGIDSNAGKCRSCVGHPTRKTEKKKPQSQKCI